MKAAGLVTLALLAGLSAPRAGAEVGGMCEVPAHCREGGTCVAGLCRYGADRTFVSPLYRVAVAEPIPATGEPWLKAEARKLALRLREDLAWTGFYLVLPPERMPPGAGQEGVSPAEMRRLSWQIVNTWRVIKTSLASTADRGVYRLRVWVMDTESFETHQLPSSDTLVRPGGTRRAAARIANELVGFDTGMPGVVGTRIAVSVQVKPGVKEVALVDADGGALTFVTRNGSLNLGPTWGPEGRIGYMSYRSGNADWVVDGEPLSTRPGLNAAGAWSPDGRWLAISLAEGGNSEISVLDGRTGEEHSRLTQHPAVDTSPAWSPDGKRLAFVSDRTGKPQIWIADMAGKAPLERVTVGGYTTSPDWSPDGQSIVYALQVEGAKFALMRYDFRTRSSTRLTPAGVSGENPSYSPDGRYIAFVQRSDTTEGGQLLSIMNADGSFIRVVGPLRYRIFSPDWDKRLP